MNFLDVVAAARLRDLAGVRVELDSVGEVAAGGRGRAAVDALARCRADGTPFVIAEVKRQSPSLGPIAPDAAVPGMAARFEAAGADAISVLTEPRWFAGSFRDLRDVAATARVPVLCKDFVVDEVQLEVAAACGAAMVLLIDRLLGQRLERFVQVARGFGLEPLVETRSAAGVEAALAAGARVVGVNARDLESLAIDTGAFEGLAGVVREHREAAFFIAESGITSAKEVRRVFETGYDGVLVGTRLMSRPDGHEFIAAIKTRKAAEQRA